MADPEAPVRYKSFYMYPEPVLRSMATTHLFQIASINHPKTPYSYNSVTAMFNSGHTIARAERGHLSLNFGSTVIQGMAMGDLDEIDAVLCEARRVIAEEGDYPPSITDLYDDLHRETTDFLDFLGISPAMNAEDLIYSTKQTVHDLHLAPVLAR